MRETLRGDMTAVASDFLRSESRSIPVIARLVMSKETGISN
jgi:hypothetical protein